MNETIRAVLITAPNAETAEKLAHGLVTLRLAACVNVLPGIMSHYLWKGKLEREAEILLIAKTREARLPELSRWIKANHPAEVPEIVALPVVWGDKPYLDWVAAGT